MPKYLKLFTNSIFWLAYPGALILLEKIFWRSNAILVGCAYELIFNTMFLAFFSGLGVVRLMML